MKCLVPVKRVIDPYVKIRVKADGSGVETDHVKMAMNPFDEIAMEAATQLKEKGLIQSILAVSVGPASAQEILRQALARGADQALLIQIEQPVQPLAVAKLLKCVVQQQNLNGVIMGKQAIDDDSNQTGQMLAALLEWPQATFASALNVDASNGTVEVTREVDGGLETVKLHLPAVITVDLRLNEPRYIALPAIMQAKRKPLEVKSITDFDVDTTPRLKCLKVAAPPVRKAGVRVQSVQELVDKLKNEAKVI